MSKAIPGPASPAGDSAIIPHQWRHMAEELAEARRQLRAAVAIDPLQAAQRRLAELAKLSTHLAGLVGGMQALVVRRKDSSLTKEMKLTDE